MRACVVVLLLASCRDRSAPAPALRCEPVLSAARDRLVALDLGGIALRTELMIAACEGDRWAPAVLRCIEVANDERALDRCLRQLTHEQYVHLSATLAPLSGQPDGSTDAGTPAGVDAPPSNASTDALVVAPLTDAARPRVRPDARKLDCTRRVIDPRDADCRRSYCDANPDAPVCLAEP